MSYKKLEQDEKLFSTFPKCGQLYIRLVECMNIYQKV